MKREPESAEFEYYYGKREVYNKVSINGSNA